MVDESSPQWRISSACVNSACVAVAMMRDGEVWVRHSSDESTVLRFSADAWRDFLVDVRIDASATGAGAT